MSDEMQKIVWHTEQRKLGELKEWKKNPRFITDKDLEQLETSLTKFGLADPLIINLDNHLIGGHQRKKALSNPEELVDVRVPDRLLTEKEAEELSIRLNKNQGEWDFDVLKVAFDNQDLVEWGFNDFELGIFQPSQDISGEWEGMPEFNQEDKTAFKTVKVHLDSQGAVDSFSELIGQKITPDTKYLWFPKLQNATFGAVVDE